MTSSQPSFTPLTTLPSARDWEIPISSLHKNLQAAIASNPSILRKCPLLFTRKLLAYCLLDDYNGKETWRFLYATNSAKGEILFDTYGTPGEVSYPDGAFPSLLLDHSLEEYTDEEEERTLPLKTASFLKEHLDQNALAWWDNPELGLYKPLAFKESSNAFFLSQESTVHHFDSEPSPAWIQEGKAFQVFECVKDYLDDTPTEVVCDGCGVIVESKESPALVGTHIMALLMRAEYNDPYAEDGCVVDRDFATQFNLCEGDRIKLVNKESGGIDCFYSQVRSAEWKSSEQEQ